MTWYRVGPAGIPGSLKTDMDAVLNKKFGTSTTYAPNTWPDNVNLLGPLPEKTASGAIANITDGADGVPVKNWQVTLPASLSGYSAIGCNVGGKNFIDFNSNLTTGTSGGLTFSETADGGISYSGTASSTFAYMTAKFDFSIASGDTFTFSRDTAFNYIHRITLTFTDDTTTNVSIASGDTSVTYTPSKDVKAVRLLVAGLTNGTAYSATVYLQTEYGNTATSFVKYTAPTTATASLGRTIYGGTADIVTGEGEAQYDITALDDKLYTYISGITRFNVAISGIDASGYKDNIVIPTGYTISHKLITNASGAPDMTMCVYNGSLYVKNLSCSSRADLQSALSGESLVFPLATPTDFTFTPITPTPETAQGVNNFWADEGDSDVTYRADISLALQALGGGGRGLMGMMMQSPEEEQLTEEDPEEQPEEAETNER